MEIILHLAPTRCPRPRVTRFGTYYPGKYNKWKKQAEGLIRQHVTEPMTGPLRLECIFTFAVPKSYTKKERAAALAGETWPRPDNDNLLKSVADALTGAGLWLDDSQAVYMGAEKRYGEIDEISIIVTNKNGS